MSQTKYIQDENIWTIITIAVGCIALIWWTYISDKKKKETEDIYTKSLSWRFYIITGIVALIMILELVKRCIALSK